MSTRATVHFQTEGETRAIVYRHGDGYPDGLGKDLDTFLGEVSKLADSRFNDASYLAAKWVVWDSQNRGSHGNATTTTLDFLSVGIVLRDPSDIDYRYLVKCDGGSGKPAVETVKL